MGRVIAFVGSEATGKSTMLEETGRWLAQTYPVNQVHAGKPPATALTFLPHVLLPALRWMFPDQRTTHVEASRRDHATGSRQTFGLLFAVRSVMLAHERRALLRRAFQQAAGGVIVLSDRYPSSGIGAPDGPQLGEAPARPRLHRWLAMLEGRLYADIPAPDLVIHLTAPLEVTLARNAARSKTEPEDYVRLRHSAASDLHFDDTAVHRITTDQPQTVVAREIREAIGGTLSMDPGVGRPSVRQPLDGRVAGQVSQGGPESLRRRSLGLGRTQPTFPQGGRAMRRDRVLRRVRKIRMDALRYAFERYRKWRRLRRTRYPVRQKLPVFVVGSNRSGTNMVCKAVGASPRGWDYPEREFSPAFNGYYLRADWMIERLIRFTPAPVVAFGSILDSQFTDDLLARFDGARALWVYRRYQDMANSCARMRWGPHLKDLVRWVARGELDRLGARGKRISADTVRLFGQLYRDDLSVEAGACLYWYMRNRLYLDLHLDQDPRVLLVQYEDAVLNQEPAFRRIFGFLGTPFDPIVLRDVSADSVGKSPWPGVDRPIEEICDDLQARLDRAFVSQRDRIATAS